MKSEGRKLNVAQLGWSSAGETRILRGRKTKLGATLQDHKNKAVTKSS